MCGAFYARPSTSLLLAAGEVGGSLFSATISLCLPDSPLSSCCTIVYRWLFDISRFATSRGAPIFARTLFALLPSIYFFLSDIFANKYRHVHGHTRSFALYIDVSNLIIVKWFQHGKYVFSVYKNVSYSCFHIVVDSKKVFRNLISHYPFRMTISIFFVISRRHHESCKYTPGTGLKYGTRNRKIFLKSWYTEFFLAVMGQDEGARKMLAGR